MDKVVEYNKKEVRKQIFLIMIPIIAENFLQLFTDLIATGMVGRLTEMDISGQGMCTKIIDFVYCVFRGCGVALVVYSARQFAKDNVTAARTLFEKLALSVIALGTFVGIILYMFPDVPMKVFTDDKVLINHAATYLKVLVPCLPFWGITVCVSSVFQGKGDTRTPMKLAVFVNIFNTLLCYGLVFGKLGMPELGYTGAALSLLISRVVGAVIGVIVLYNKKVGLFTFYGKRVKVENALTDIYTMGLPSAGESIVWQVASVLLSRIILFYGSSAFAAYQLGIQAEYVTEIPAIGFSVAAVSLVSKSIALEDREQFAILKKELIRLCVGISIVTSSLLMFLPHVFMRALTTNEELARIAIPYVIIMGTIQIPQNLSKVNAGILRSAGYKVLPLMIQMTGTWGFRLVVACICAYVLHLPLISIWICIALDQIGKYIAFRYQVNHREMFRDKN